MEADPGADARAKVDKTAKKKARKKKAVKKEAGKRKKAKTKKESKAKKMKKDLVSSHHQFCACSAINLNR